MHTADEPAVPPYVLATFGLVGPPQQLTGGMGTSVRVGEAVLKPVGDDPEAAWLAGVLDTIEPRGIRTPRPLRAPDGRWVVDGWTATTYLPGREARGRWADTIDAGRSLHEALRDVPRPELLRHRNSPWATADRVAWNEQQADLDDFGPALLRRVSPTRLRRQLVHCDLAGNALFHPIEPPALIDLSLYWRPPAYAEAVVVVDALLWYGADDSVLDLVDHTDMLLRALMFRWATERSPDRRGVRTPQAIWERVAALVLSVP